LIAEEWKLMDEQRSRIHAI